MQLCINVYSRHVEMTPPKEQTKTNWRVANHIHVVPKLFTKLGPSPPWKLYETSASQIAKQCHVSVSTRWLPVTSVLHTICQLLANIYFGGPEPQSWHSTQNRPNKIVKKIKPYTKSEYAAISNSEKMLQIFGGSQPAIQTASKFQIFFKACTQSILKAF